MNEVYLGCFESSVAKVDGFYPRWKSRANIAVVRLLSLAATHLTTDIPDGETDVLVFHCFNIEA